MKLFMLLLGLFAVTNAFQVVPAKPNAVAVRSAEPARFAAPDMKIRVPGSTSPHGTSEDQFMELKELTPQITLIWTCITVYEICKWMM